MMTIIDTSILSETTRPLPAESVMRWMREQPGSHLYTTSITESELLLGVELLPDGKRKDAIRSAVERILYQVLDGRILLFDSEAARFAAQIVARRRKKGRRINPADAQIAAIARTHGYSIATRNVTDFADCEVPLINPWQT